MGTEKRNIKKGELHGKPIEPAMREMMINQVADLYLKGQSYRQIAKLVEETHFRSISIVTVGNYVAKLLTEWRKARVEKLDDLKTIELNRINKLEQTYWDGWERSLEGSKRSSEKQKAAPKAAVGPGGTMTETMAVMSGEKSTYTEETFGDPRFLGGIQWCIAMRCKILGIEAPIEFKGKITSDIKHTTVFKTRLRVKP